MKLRCLIQKEALYKQKEGELHAKNKSEQEKAYLEIKYLYSQLEDDVPQDIRDQIKRNLEKACPTGYLQYSLNKQKVRAGRWNLQFHLI